MTVRSLQRPPLAVAVLAVALLAAACGASGAPPATGESTPAAATPKITFPPRPTALPTATLPPTASPQPTPAGGTGTGTGTDLASDLRVGSPYRLVDNPRNTALTGSFQFDVAGQHIAAGMNGREVWNGKALVGAAVVMRFTGIPMTTQVFEAAAKGGANNVNGRLTYDTVLGTRVAYITNATTTVGMFPLHGSIVMIAGTTATGTKALLASIIKANK